MLNELHELGGSLSGMLETLREELRELANADVRAVFILFVHLVGC